LKYFDVTMPTECLINGYRSTQIITQHNLLECFSTLEELLVSNSSNYNSWSSTNSNTTLTDSRRLSDDRIFVRGWLYEPLIVTYWKRIQNDVQDDAKWS